ncbi:MAG: T9SS type A sorting domain-containing protein [Bacteroidia bacterium]|nr:T9SS type A sorting domain-containing protein [Bacteroidia bacterium]
MKNILVYFLLFLVHLSVNGQIRMLKTISGHQHKPHDMYGWQVLQNETQLFVSSPYEDGINMNDGSVYIYNNINGTIQFAQRIMLANPVAFALLGQLMATDGNNLVLTTATSVQTPYGKGYIHLYVKSDSGWQHVNTIAETVFKGQPTSISLHRQHLAVGSAISTEEHPHGYVEVFNLSDGIVNGSKKIEVMTLSNQQVIGHAVDVHDDYLVCSSTHASGSQYASGKVWVYKWVNQTWESQFDIEHADGSPYDFFGMSVSISFPYVAIGAPRQSVGGGKNTGAVYIYNIVNNAYTLEAKLLPQGSVAEYDYFGSSVSIENDHVAVGAYGDDFSGKNAGAAYLFKRMNSNWSLQQKFTSNQTNIHGSFGSSVHLYKHRLLVSAHLEELDSNTNHGAVYYYPNVTLINGLTNITEQPKGSLFAYPNPFKDQFIIKNSHEVKMQQLEVYTSTGQLLFTFTDKQLQNTTIDTKSWETGYYYLVFTCVGEQYIQHVIKIE